MMIEMENHYDECTDMVATVYAANFSAQELREIGAFYHTPTGQKLLRRLDRSCWNARPRLRNKA